MDKLQPSRRDFLKLNIVFVALGVISIVAPGCAPARPLNSGDWLDTGKDGTTKLTDRLIYLDAHHHAVVDTVTQLPKNPVGNISMIGVVTEDLKDTNSPKPKQLIISTKLSRGPTDQNIIETIHNASAQLVDLQFDMLSENDHVIAIKDNAFLFLIPDGFGSFPNAVWIHGEGMDSPGTAAIGPFLDDLPNARRDLRDIPFRTANDYISNNLGPIPGWPDGMVMLYGSAALIGESLRGLQSTSTGNLNSHLIEFDYQYIDVQNTTITISELRGSNSSGRKKIISTLRSTNEGAFPWDEVRQESSQVLPKETNLITRRDLSKRLASTFKLATSS